MLNKCIIIFSILSLAVIPWSWADSGPDFDEGSWSITVTFTITGMPMQMPPSTFTQCMTKDAPVPQDDKPNQACTQTNVQTKGNTVTWTMSCDTPGGKMTGDGKITYQKTKLTGTMTMKQQDMTIEYQFDGYRVGLCQ